MYTVDNNNIIGFIELLSAVSNSFKMWISKFVPTDRPGQILLKKSLKVAQKCCIKLLKSCSNFKKLLKIALNIKSGSTHFLYKGNNIHVSKKKEQTYSIA